MDEPTAALTHDRGRSPLRRRRDAARAGRRGALHLAPARRGLRALPARHGDARRAPRHDRGRSRTTTQQRLIHAMVGRDLDALFPKEVAEVGATVLKVERLTREGVFTDVSFEVKAGEIVALAGLVGAGRSEVARAIFGIDRADAGSVEVNGRKLPPASPNAAMAAGIGLVPEDRRQQGLVMPISIERNMALASLDRLRRLLLIPRLSERRFASEWATRLQLRYGRLTDPASTLSGGNQQKVVLAKWLARAADAADRRRADARHRRRHQGRGAPPALGSRERGRRDPHDLERAARGARHGRSRDRAVRGPRRGRVRPQPRPTRSRSCAPPPASRSEEARERASTQRSPAARARAGPQRGRDGRALPRARHRARAR